MPTSGLIEPTPLQLALALTLNRSKPANVSVREYILTLRQHIRSGQRPQFSATYDESQKNYINAANYFESLLKDAQKTNEKLRNRVALLERHYGAIDEALSDNAGRETEPKRRKKNVPKKKTKPSNEDDFGKIFERLRQVERIELETDDSLLRHVYSLQRSLQGSNRSPRIIGRSLRQVCNAFVGLLDSNSSQSPPIGHENLTLALNRVLILVFNGFNILVSSSYCDSASGSAIADEGHRSLGPTIYTILAVFQAILDSLNNTADSRPQNIGQPPQRRRPNLRRNPRSTSESPTALDHAKRLAQTFVILIIQYTINTTSSPHLCSEPHANLLEGTLHILLTRAGTLLYASTFSTSRGESISDEIAAPPLAAAATNAATDEASSANQVQAAVERKGRQILSLLGLVLPQCRYTGASPLVETDGNGDCSGAAPLATRSRARHSHADLVGKPLHVLQNTLVSGLFGSVSCEASRLDEEIFGETLRCGALPPADGGRFDDDEVSEDEEGSGFARGLWEMVGWDVLARGFGAAEDQVIDRRGASAD